MKYLLFFLTSIYCLAVHAVSINGHIYDMDTQKPVNNATLSVFVKGQNEKITAITDTNGGYTIQLPATWIEGEYSMTLTQEDYYTVNGIVLVKDQAVRNFYMKINPGEPAEAASASVETPVLVEAPMPTSNLVFLIDVSASMNEDKKIDMLKIALKQLASLLRPTDKVSIVVYSTEARIYMKTTTGDNVEKIHAAIDSLTCKGITMGGLGLDLAYTVAKKNYLKGENNKVILVTDGKFTSTETKQYASMEKLINKMYSKKIALTVFSFGKLVPRTKENLRKLSEIGGGTYAHIENEEMAIEEMIDEAKNLGVFNK